MIDSAHGGDWPFALSARPRHVRRSRRLASRRDRRLVGRALEADLPRAVEGEERRRAVAGRVRDVREHHAARARGRRELRIFDDQVRETTVFAVQEALELRGGARRADVEDDSIDVDVDVSAMRTDRRADRARHDDRRRGARRVGRRRRASQPVGGRWRIDARGGSRRRRTSATSVIVHGNVALATHGETVQQLLGSGRASEPFQRFTLAHEPLTYVQSSSDPSGARLGARGARERRALGRGADAVRRRARATARTRSAPTRRARRTSSSATASTARACPSGSNNVRAEVPQGHRRRRQRQGRRARAAARPPARRQGREQSRAGERRRRSRDGGVGARVDPARRAHARTRGLAARLRGLRARVQRRREGATPRCCRCARGGRSSSPSRSRAATGSTTSRRRCARTATRAWRCVVLAGTTQTFKLALKVAVDPAYEADAVLAGVESALRDGVLVRRAGVRASRCSSRRSTRSRTRSRACSPSTSTGCTRARRPGSPSGSLAQRPAVGARRRAAIAGRRCWSSIRAVRLAGGDDVTRSPASTRPRRSTGCCPRSTACATRSRAACCASSSACITDQVNVLAESLEQLYDDQFVETCAPWVAPYIGDLVGYRTLHGVVPQVASPRAEVANTIRYRRRKGTVSVLEQLAARRHRLARARRRVLRAARDDAVHEPHPPARRRDRGPARRGAARARRQRSRRARSTASRTRPRCAASRRGSGRYNIPNVGIFLWRVQALRLARSPLVDADGAGLRFRFDPLGTDKPLFAQPRTEQEITHLAEPLDVPLPLQRRFAKRAPRRPLRRRASRSCSRSRPQAASTRARRRRPHLRPLRRSGRAGHVGARAAAGRHARRGRSGARPRRLRRRARGRRDAARDVPLRLGARDRRRRLRPRDVARQAEHARDRLRRRPARRRRSRRSPAAARCRSSTAAATPRRRRSRRRRPRPNAADRDRRPPRRRTARARCSRAATSSGSRWIRTRRSS